MVALDAGLLVGLLELGELNLDVLVAGVNVRPKRQMACALGKVKEGMGGEWVWARWGGVG